MLEKIKKNWLMKLLILLLSVFILSRVFLTTKNDGSSSISQSNTTLVSTVDDLTNKSEVFEIDPDRDDILLEGTSGVNMIMFDILEYVPYETNEFKIVSLDDETNILTVKAKVDKETALKIFNEFVEREVTKESRTFEVVWQ